MADKEKIAKETKDNKELKTALAAIEKEFGKGAIMSLGDINVDDIEGISTGRCRWTSRSAARACARSGVRDLRC